jgi:hypothetical protein
MLGLSLACPNCEWSVWVDLETARKLSVIGLMGGRMVCPSCDHSAKLDAMPPVPFTEN